MLVFIVYFPFRAAIKLYYGNFRAKVIIIIGLRRLSSQLFAVEGYYSLYHPAYMMYPFAIFSFISFAWLGSTFLMNLAGTPAHSSLGPI